MKTKELIEQINKSLYIRVYEDTYNLNFHTETSDLCFYILSNYSMEISQATTTTINLSGATLRDLSEMILLLNEWLETPVEDREEEKRYRLRIVANLGFRDAQRFLNLNIEREEYFICSARQSEWVKTIFTESEIAEMDITGFEKIEVTP